MARVVLERFEILKTLGEGQFGRVYQAFDRYLGREIALKEFSEKVSEKGGASFQREMRLLSHLDHPALVKVYDLLVDEATGLHYFSQDLVRGRDLGSYLRAATWEQRWRVIVQALQGLEYLHQRNLIHLDVKPSNILVDERGEKPQAKVLDFGITEEVSRFDRKRIVAGTFPYMAPEVARRDAADGRADLYSFGMSLLEVFQREKEACPAPPAPAESADLTAGTVAEDHTVAGDSSGGWDIESLVRQTLTRRPPAPEEFGPDVPGALRDIVITLLDPSPGRRFWSANDVIRRINRVCHESFDLEPGRRRLPDKGTAILLGMERVLKQLRSRMDEVSRGMTGLVVDIMEGGPQGGKSAVLEQLKREAELADRPLIVLAGHQDGMAQLFGRILGSAPPASITPLAPYLKCLMPERFSTAADPPDLDAHPDLQRRARMDKWAQALVLALGARKVLLLVDDLDRKEELRDSLADLSSHMHGASPLLGSPRGLLHVVATTSVRPDGPAQPWDGCVFHLAAWGEEDLAAVLPSLLGTSATPLPLARFLLQHTEGRPGLVVEYLRFLLSNVLRPEEDISGQLETMDLDRLGGRFDLASWYTRERDALAVAERRALVWLGVSPVALAASDLALLEPDLAEGSVQLLRTLEGSGWLRDVGAGARAISSELRRSSVLSGVAAELAIRCHRTIAEKWDELAEVLRGVLAGPSGELLRAGEYFRGGEAREGFRLAGPRVVAMLRSGQAGPVHRFLESHLAAAGGLSEGDSMAYRGWLAESRLLAGAYSEAIAAYEELRSMARNRAERGVAALGLARACRYAGRLEQALQTTLQAGEEAEGGGDDALALDALQADIYLELGRFQEAERIARSRLEGGGGSFGPVRLAFRNILGKCLFFRSALDEAATLFELNSKDAKELGRSDVCALSHNALGVARLHQGRLEEATERLREALDSAQEVGDMRTVALASANLGLAHQRLGEPKAGVEYYEKAAAMFRRIGAGAEEARTLYNLGVLRSKMRDLEGAVEVLARAGELAKANGMKHLESNVRLAESNCLLLRGSPAAALETCNRALAGFEAAKMERDALSARLRRAEILAALGRREEAQSELDTSEQGCGATASPSLRAAWLYVRGLLQGAAKGEEAKANLTSALQLVRSEEPKDIDLEQKVVEVLGRLEVAAPADAPGRPI